MTSEKFYNVRNIFYDVRKIFYDIRKISMTSEKNLASEFFWSLKISKSLFGQLNLTYRKKTLCLTYKHLARRRREKIQKLIP